MTSTIIDYVKRHGGGTVAVASQSSAASAIISGDVEVAGIGGFSGRESDVSVAWLAQEVRSGKIRWVLDESGGGGFGRLPGDTRTGSQTAMSAVAKECTAVTLPGSSASSAGVGGSTSSAAVGGASTGGTLYDCKGSATALLSAAKT